jgi:Metallo-beta-lactamase superfamily
VAAGSCASSASSHRPHPEHRASSYAHELGSQERKLGRIEQVPDIRGWGAGVAALGPRRAGGSTSTRATSGPGAGPGRVTGQGAARLSPSPGLAAGQATQVVSHGRHHHNRLSVASVPWFLGLNARAGSPQNRHSGPPSARAWIHPTRGIDLKPTYLWLRTSRHWPEPLPIKAYVIGHRDGIELFDTGQDRRRSPTRATSPAAPPEIPLQPPRALRHRPGNTLTARLEAIGYDLANVGTTVLSDLHQDHIGGLPELERRPGARISR